MNELVDWFLTVPRTGAAEGSAVFDGRQVTVWSLPGESAGLVASVTGYGSASFTREEFRTELPKWLDRVREFLAANDGNWGLN